MILFYYYRVCYYNKERYYISRRSEKIHEYACSWRIYDRNPIPNQQIDFVSELK